MQIYKITNTLNKKVYIGKDESSRETYYGSGKLIRRAIEKYGIENFSKDILDTSKCKKELQEKEIYWIKEYNSTDREIGYNISYGGDGGDTISNHPNKDEICKKISKSSKGRIFTEEHRTNLIKNHHKMSQRDKFKTQEDYNNWLVKIREIHSNRRGKSLEEISGVKKAKEIKEVLKEKRAERADFFNMKVGKFTKQGKLITIYSSQKEASIKEGIRQGDISNCIKGRQRTVKGFIWKKL